MIATFSIGPERVATASLLSTRASDAARNLVALTGVMSGHDLLGWRDVMGWYAAYRWNQPTGGCKGHAVLFGSPRAGKKVACVGYSVCATMCHKQYEQPGRVEAVQLESYLPAVASDSGVPAMVAGCSSSPWGALVHSIFSGVCLWLLLAPAQTAVQVLFARARLLIVQSLIAAVAVAGCSQGLQSRLFPG